MTPAEIAREKAYRYDEAIALNRTPERAAAEVADWEKSLTQTPNETKTRLP